MFAQVAIENTSFRYDKLFTYAVPADITLQPGMRVTVPFGGGNKTRVAMVFSVTGSYDGDISKIKEIISVLDKEALLDSEMLSLAVWMKERYYCTYFDAVKLMVPAGAGYKLNFSYEKDSDISELEEVSLTEIQRQILSFLNKGSLNSNELKKYIGIDDSSKEIVGLVRKGFVKRTDLIKRRIGDASAKMVMACWDFEGKLTPRQQSVYETLCEVGVVSVKELCYFTGASAVLIKNLLDKGAVKVFDEERYRRPESAVSADRKRLPEQLSAEQEKVYRNLVKEYEEGKGKVSLLYGVTGSGKTSVFLKFIEYVVGRGKQVIVMVPEISLTPQTIQIFKSKFGDDIAVFHSALSIGERLDEWKRVSRGEAKIVVGTRSAVFAPCRNLGLIVMDEEQEHTYKSETNPRYHAREVARYRVAHNAAFCLLCSATPSLESFHLAKKGHYGFNELTERYGEARIPEVKVVDMNQEQGFGGRRDISEYLRMSLNQNLEDGKQSIILLNRRGYHTFVRCSSCHEVVTCPNCSISMTYHSANDRLMCHYCGYSRKFSTKCPVCGEDKVSFSGYGTQRAEEALAAAVPGAKVLRIDADTINTKHALERKLDAFARGDYDIMVGTQMVAKGLNFENVTLVGVLSADQNLYSDDYRSSERTFDLLTQVIGRAGRGKFPGTAVIQSEVPENPYLRLAAAQDYYTFYEMECEYRKAMLYPPFVDIVVVGFVGEGEKYVKNAADVFLEIFRNKAGKEYSDIPLRVLKPTSAAVAKISGKYRYKIIIKCKNNRRFRSLMTESLKEFGERKDCTKVTAFVDTNPENIM